MVAPQFLILPGWQNSGPLHWQSIWEAQLSAHRVMQHDWMHPLRGDWITRLEDHLLSFPKHSTRVRSGVNEEDTSNRSAQTKPEPSVGDIVFVAHSLGCHLVAAWAAVSPQSRRIRGALLVAPPDVGREDFPVQMHSWRRPERANLPFPSICVISSNDPFCSLSSARAMAQDWGSEVVEIGERGHINAESELGDWAQGKALLARLAG